MESLKLRATCEDLLGLGIEGWQEIAMMDDAQLEVYLKDITAIEPKIDPAAQLRGRVIKELKEQQQNNEQAGDDDNNNASIDGGDDNPIKSKRKVKKNKNKSTIPVSELKSLFKDLDIEL